MNAAAVRRSVESEIAAFSSTIRFVYRGAQWDDIRRDVEATWNRCGLAYGATWAQVEAVVREEWQRQDPIPARLIARE